MNDLKNKYECIKVVEENIYLKVKENLPPNSQIESKTIINTTIINKTIINKNSFDLSLIEI